LVSLRPDHTRRPGVLREKVCLKPRPKGRGRSGPSVKARTDRLNSCAEASRFDASRGLESACRLRQAFKICQPRRQTRERPERRDSHPRGVPNCSLVKDRFDPCQADDCRRRAGQSTTTIRIIKNVSRRPARMWKKSDFPRPRGPPCTTLRPGSLPYDHTTAPVHEAREIFAAFAPGRDATSRHRRPITPATRLCRGDSSGVRFPHGEAERLRTATGCLIIEARSVSRP